MIFCKILIDFRTMNGHYFIRPFKIIFKPVTLPDSPKNSFNKNLFINLVVNIKK